MAVPRDYDASPGRFRLGARVTTRYLTGGQGIYPHIAGLLDRAGARLVADIGCGEGALAAASRSPQPRIVGIDASPTMLAACPGPRVQADARQLPFASGSFDAAVMANMLYHLRDPAEAIREARRVLSGGGQFIATAISRHDSPELAAVWKPAPSTFDAEDAPAIVASVFGAADVEPWDAPLITLPDRGAVRDYLIARFVPQDQAVAAAARVSTPATITKRGAFISATKLRRPSRYRAQATRSLSRMRYRHDSSTSSPSVSGSARRISTASIRAALAGSVETGIAASSSHT